MEKKREHFLVATCLAFQQLYKKEKGYREVVLTTATEASKEVKDLLNKKIADKLDAKVAMKTVVDEELIGIAAQLENMKKELLSK